MGKRVNFNNLKDLYAAATNFETKIHGTMERIQININKLTDPAFSEGLQGGQGDLAVEAIKQGSEALDALKAAIGNIRLTVDKKIGEGQAMRSDRSGFGEAAAKQKQTAAEARHRRR